MNCSSCQQGNPDSARFCNSCGAPLQARCASCNGENPPGARFCNGCGAELGGAPAKTAADPVRNYTPPHLAAKILSQKAALEGERKHVTVLFADLADSTAIAAELGADEMHTLMDGVFKPILEQVHRYEGTVNQFTGDGVMALFGAPLALEDAPRRAVSAALGIQEALQALDGTLHARSGRHFRMRIGIHSGPVVVGKIGDDLRMDYTAVGDTTNLASRLEQLAPLGGVVISDTTRRLVEGYFDLRPLPPQQVKGISEAVLAHEVVGTTGISGRIDTQSEFSAYVGRSRELNALSSAFESACSNHGQLAFVVGDAGIGKSRLLFELRKQFGEIPHLWFEGRCSSLSGAAAFHPIADGLRRFIGIEDRDDDLTAAGKLAAMADTTGGGLEWTLPYLRSLLSLPTEDESVDAIDAMTRRSESCRALQALFLRLSEKQPLIFVIEDLHWIDPASEDFLGLLAESVPAARLLLVFTHRPGYEQPFGDRSFHVRIPVRPLPAEAMGEMVSSVLETSELPLELAQLISEKAEGNPLFIEELVSSLLEEGVIRSAEGRLELVQDLSKISVPDRIQDVLMARLDRLPEGSKHAIQIASVIGREFAMRLLERITEMGEDLGGIVGELRSLELIYEKASHPELAYMFKHALTHDVAYASVLLKRRKALHLIVGSAIEELYRDRLAEHYEALAHHFSSAEEWARALDYYELASAKASSAYANQAAADHCRAGLAVADRLGEAVSAERRANLAMRLAASCWSLSEFGASAEAYHLAADLAETAEDRAMALARASMSELWNHDYERGSETQTQARELAEAHGARAAHAFSLVVRGELDLVQGRELGDPSRFEPAVVLAERSGDPAVIVQSYSHMSQMAEWQSDFRRSISYGQKAVALAVRERIPGDALFGQWFMGISFVCMGEYGRGLSVLGEGLDLSDRIGDRALKARLLNTLGWCYAEFGAYERAARYNRMGTSLGKEMVELGLVKGAPELHANAAINLAGNFTALGELEEASELLAEIQAACESDGDPWMRWRYSTHLRHGEARVALARGDADRALEISGAELVTARAAKSPKLEARALEFNGRVLLASERREDAARSLLEALEMASRIEYPAVAWRALSLLGELAARNGRTQEAEQNFVKASALIEAKARTLPDTELRRQCLAMGERLVTTPVDAYR